MQKPGFHGFRFFFFGLVFQGFCGFLLSFLCFVQGFYGFLWVFLLFKVSMGFSIGFQDFTSGSLGPSGFGFRRALHMRPDHG